MSLPDALTGAARFASCSLPIVAVFLAAVACGTASCRPPLPTRVYTSSVDWYKPAPKAFSKATGSTDIPFGLIMGVKRESEDKAVAMLGNAEVIALKPRAVSQFVNLDAEKALQSVISELEGRVKGLQWVYQHAHNAEHRRQLEPGLATFQQDVAMVRAWKGKLNPYLIKAVSLGQRGPFYARIVGDDLEVVQFAVGRRPLPMIRMPVVAFLPSRPKHVYNDVTMME